MHVILNSLFLIAAFKWGDWRNWIKYYPTILFFIGGDLLKNALLHDYRMWVYKETFFFENIFIGHLSINLMIMFVAYPSTILIYLGRFPHTKGKQTLWMILWILIYSLIEFMNLRYLNLIEHAHGWTMPWSLLFNAVMFTVLRIHLKKPMLAWVVSLIWLIFLYQYFSVPNGVFK